MKVVLLYLSYRLTKIPGYFSHLFACEKLFTASQINTVKSTILFQMKAALKQTPVGNQIPGQLERDLRLAQQWFG